MKQFVTDETGKLSATRAIFLLWGIGALIGWVGFGREVTTEIVMLLLSLGAVKAYKDTTRPREPKPL